MAFFEELGVPLKVERGRRVFPVSDRAFDVSAALERELRRLRVTLVRDRAVCVLTDETGAVRGVKGEKGTYPAQAVVLATGGVSYRGTGSTGEGHRIAAMLGHTVTPLTGSLVAASRGRLRGAAGLEPAERGADGLRERKEDLHRFRGAALHAFRRVRPAGALVLGAYAAL